MFKVSGFQVQNTQTHQALSKLKQLNFGLGTTFTVRRLLKEIIILSEANTKEYQEVVLKYLKIDTQGNMLKDSEGQIIPLEGFTRYDFEEAAMPIVSTLHEVKLPKLKLSELLLGKGPSKFSVEDIEAISFLIDEDK